MELLLSVETAKITQQANMCKHIKTMQNLLNEKTSEVTKIKGQLDQVKPQIE